MKAASFTISKSSTRVPESHLTVKWNLPVVSSVMDGHGNPRAPEDEAPIRAMLLRPLKAAVPQVAGPASEEEGQLQAMAETHTIHCTWKRQHVPSL